MYSGKIILVEVDTALLRNTRREFRTLEKKWRDNPTPDDILEIAGALRHLLIDEGGLFRRSWKQLKLQVGGMPKEPAISLVDLGWILDLRLPHIESGESVVLATDITAANGGRIMASAFHANVIPS